MQGWYIDGVPKGDNCAWFTNCHWSDYIHIDCAALYAVYQAVQVHLRHALAHKQYGRALKILHKQMEDKGTRDMDKRAIEVTVLTAK